MRRKLLACITAVYLAFTIGDANSTKFTRPPKPAELVGVWIGFEGDGSEMMRMEIRPDLTGYAVCIQPAEFVGARYHPSTLYKLNGVTVGTDHHFSFEITPGRSNESSRARPPNTANVTAITLGTGPTKWRAHYKGSGLQLDTLGKDGQSKNVILYREQHVDATSRIMKGLLDQANEKQSGTDHDVSNP